MDEARFTGKKFATYLPLNGGADLPAFTQALRIINGQSRTSEIAEFALEFQLALKAGQRS